jgi:hypothetical protein
MRRGRRRDIAELKGLLAVVQVLLELLDLLGTHVVDTEPTSSGLCGICI